MKTETIVWPFKLIAALGLISATLHAQNPAEDRLLTTPASPEVTVKGLEADGYHLGISVYTWGYPVVRMERVMRRYIEVPDPKPATSYRAPLNQIGWARELATPQAKDMPTANNDTMYMSAVVALDQPYILSVPDTNDRYYVVDVFNMWQELEHYIGRRTTGTKAGKYAIVPPGWKGELPSGVQRLDVSTDKVWLWGRIFLAQGEDVKLVARLQDQFALTPLDASSAKKATLPTMPAEQNGGLEFLSDLSFALRFNAIKPVDEALFGQFTRIGLVKEGFNPSKMSDAMRKGLLRGLADGPAVVISSFASTSAVRNGWNWVTGLDSFGFNYPMRAMVAGPYLGGNGEKEAVYPIRYTDSEGKTLSGSNRYEIKLDRDPPVGAFWSLTMYNASDKMLVENPINRYKVGSDTQGLKHAADGSITIPIQTEKPAGDAAANWLPAPKGDFYLMLRFYQPSEEILNNTYKLPQVKKLN